MSDCNGDGDDDVDGRGPAQSRVLDYCCSFVNYWPRVNLPNIFSGFRKHVVNLFT
jgi:hypothetical protein